MRLAEWMSTEADVAAYHREIWLRSAAILATLLLCHVGWLPVWALVLANIALYPGIYLRVHDIGHGVPVVRYGIGARFVPVAHPIWGGTRVFAHIHNFHHSYFGTDHDPWLPYYTGHPLRALFFNLIEPEYSFVQFLKRRGWDRELISSMVVHVAVFALGLALFGGLYLFHAVIQRLVHMTGIFFFNFYTHRETLSADAAIGNWEREGELQRLLPLFRRIWGAHVVDGLVFHNRHHCIGQTHVPVQHYKHLPDTRRVSRFLDEWPIRAIVQLDGGVRLPPDVADASEDASPPLQRLH
jgi:hypothetical protein